MSSSMSTGLTMQIAQKLDMVMTPQMIQSMELLQMPIMQLEQKLRKEQLENPVLEIKELENEDETENIIEKISTNLEEQSDTQEDSYISENELAEENNEFTDTSDIDCDWDIVYDDNHTKKTQSYNEDDEEYYDPIIQAAAPEISLTEYLMQQVNELTITNREKNIVTTIIANLDYAGYLKTDINEIVVENEKDVEPDEIENAIEIVQELEPLGIGARSLEECLAIQLKKQPKVNIIAVKIVEKHLEDLAANRIPKIAKELHCNIEEVKEAIQLIKTLKPKPASMYNPEPAMVVKPELIIKGDDQEGFRVQLTSGIEPIISDFYIALFDNSKRGKILRKRLENDPAQAEEFKNFKKQMRETEWGRKLREKYNNAQWLLKAVAQREKTLLTITREIVKVQHDYLAGKTDAPAPLMMQEVADKVGYDISTVSRAVKDKCIDTPLGIKFLKDFFVRSTVKTSGNEKETSNAEVLLKIKEILENEDKKRPLRDNEIMEQLENQGIKIKRRSVVNYREKLGIPSHSQRREY